MAWVRIHDGALGHPKIFGLFSWKDPLHVWVWGLSHCQTHLTDGLIARVVIPAAGAKAVAALVAKGLWDADEEGWRVHDYHDWNDSRAEIERKRTDAKARMSAARDRVRSSDVRANIPTNNSRTSPDVLRGVVSVKSSSERESEGKPRDPEVRAGILLQELYPAWYSKWRHGAKLRLVSNSLAYADAVTLCQTWDDARLEKLAQIVLTTDDDWISTTDRGFKIFAVKASWADDRLKQAEQGAA